MPPEFNGSHGESTIEKGGPKTENWRPSTLRGHRAKELSKKTKKKSPVI